MSTLSDELHDLKLSISSEITTLIGRHRVTNVATFWIYIDISDTDLEEGGADDQPDFFKAVQEYMDAIETQAKGQYVNARLVAALTDGQEIILHQVGSFR